MLKRIINVKNNNKMMIYLRLGKTYLKIYPTVKQNNIKEKHI